MLLTNTYFYAFYSENELIGCIYLYNKDNKLFLNGFASRGHHELNMEAMKMVEELVLVRYLCRNNQQAIFYVLT